MRDRGGVPEFNAEDFEARYEAGMFEFVIAVDAGFAYLEELGVKPDMAVGDFDSLGYLPGAPPRVAIPGEEGQKRYGAGAWRRAVAWDYDDLGVYAALRAARPHHRQPAAVREVLGAGVLT